MKTIKTSAAIAISWVVFLIPNFSCAANKCTSSDGRVSFQDTPCPSSSTVKEAIKLRSETNTMSSAGAFAVGELDLSGPAAQRANRAIAALEVLSQAGLDCKIKLDVYGPNVATLDVCQNFSKHHSAWWKPASETLAALAKDEDFGQNNVAALREGLRHMQRINSYSEFILLKMKSSR